MNGSNQIKTKRLIEVQSRAINVLGEQYFEHWLDTPKLALDNKIPLELVQTKQGYEDVLNLLGRIEQGVFS